jgi:hypothetical protein
MEYVFDCFYAHLMACDVPPGWPVGVHPPGSEGFEQTAVIWLLDVVPPDYRVHGVLRRHPLELAELARHHLAACVQGAREGYRAARTELGPQLPQRGLEAVLAAYRAEGSRLVSTARAVDLVSRALRGEVLVPRSATVMRGRGNPRGPAHSAAHSPAPARPSGTTPPSPPGRRSRPRPTRARTAAEARAR